MAFLFVFLAGWLPIQAYSQTTSANEVSHFLRTLSELEESLKNRPECAAYANEAKISCNEITDSVCHTLWNGKNLGNMPVFDGEIASGKTKGNFPKYKLIHYQAIADSGPNLASDLKEATKDIRAKMKAALAAEEDSKKWRRTLDDLKNEFSRTMYDVADQRQKQKYPEIMAKPEAKRSVEENNTVDLIPNQIEDEVIDAVYGKHPNWLRALNVFEQTKADIVASVKAMDIPEKTKATMLTQLDAAKLTLPYTSDFGLDAEDDCSSTTVNAYYFSSRNELVVCAGLFNSFQSESSLYFVLAHELGHSIDTTRLSQFDYRENSAVYKNLAKLVPKDKMSCEDWAKAKQQILDRPQEFQPVDGQRPLEKLISCLKDRSQLKKFESSQMRALADYKADEDLAWYADRNQFLKISQPTITENGELRPNPYYLKPENFNSYLRPPFSDGKYRLDSGPRDIFYRELTCAAGSGAGGGASCDAIKDKKQRAKIFKTALDVTQQILRAKTEDWFTFCGRGCTDLAAHQLSANSNENAADWFAFQATQRYLARIDDQASRREASALSTALFCDQPSAVNDAPELAALEKEFSQESHPDNRIRRISLYSKAISGIVGCETTPGTQGFSECSP